MAKSKEEVKSISEAAKASRKKRKANQPQWMVPATDKPLLTADQFVPGLDGYRNQYADTVINPSAQPAPTMPNVTDNFSPRYNAPLASDIYRGIPFNRHASPEGLTWAKEALKASLAQGDKNAAEVLKQIELREINNYLDAELDKADSAPAAQLPPAPVAQQAPAARRLPPPPARPPIPAATMADIPTGPPTAFDAGAGTPPPPPAPVMPIATDPPVKPVNLDAIEARRQELRAKLAQGMQAYRATGQLPAGWQDPAKAVPVTPAAQSPIGASLEQWRSQNGGRRWEENDAVPMGQQMPAFRSVAPTAEIPWQDQATLRGLANPPSEQAAYDALVSELAAQADRAMSAANPLEGRMGNVYDRGIGLTQELYGTGYVPNYMALQGTAADPFAPGEREQLQQIASMQAHNEALRQGIRSNGAAMSPAMVGTLGNPYGPDMGRQDIAGIGDRERMNQERLAQLAAAAREDQQRAQSLVGKQYSGGSVVRQRPDGSVYVTGPNAGSVTSDRQAQTKALVAQRLKAQRDREQAAQARMLAARGASRAGLPVEMYNRLVSGDPAASDLLAVGGPDAMRNHPDVLNQQTRMALAAGYGQGLANRDPATPMPEMPEWIVPSGEAGQAANMPQLNTGDPWTSREAALINPSIPPRDIASRMAALGVRDATRIRRAIAIAHGEEVAAETMDSLGGDVLGSMRPDLERMNAAEAQRRETERRTANPLSGSFGGWAG